MQFWKTPGPQSGHGECAQSTQDHRWHGPKPLRCKARFKLTEFVGSADKNHVHGVDAATHFVGRANLYEHLANNDADHVRRADEKEREQRKGEASGNAEEDCSNAKSGHAPQHR